MENSININENVIHYVSDIDLPHLDKSWKLNVADIKVIGYVNRMVGDDDSFFLVFIDGSASKYFMQYGQEISGWPDFERLLKEQFAITLPEQLYDTKVVLYPKHLSGLPLYKFQLIAAFKVLAAVTHAADGALSDEILAELGVTHNAR